MNINKPTNKTVVTTSNKKKNNQKLRSNKIKSLFNTNLGYGTKYLLKPLTTSVAKSKPVSFVKLFNNFERVDKNMYGTRFTLGDITNINGYKRMNEKINNQWVDEFQYSVVQIYYPNKSITFNYYLSPTLNSFYHIPSNTSFMVPNESLIVEIRQTKLSTDSKVGFFINPSEIIISNTIIEDGLNPAARCGQGLKSSFCDFWLDRINTYKNIIFISENPIESKYISSLDGLTVL